MDESIKKVFIVDDEANIRQSFVDYFEDHLWQTLQADSGEQALKILDKDTADAAIVDIRLPGMNGDVFIRKASEKNPEMVFVICTGSPEYRIPDDLLKNSHVSGDILWKPVTNINKIEKELLRLLMIHK